MSGIYNNIVASILDESAHSTDKSGSVPLDDPRVRQIANEAFSPSYIKQNAETVVDGVYNWLDGKTSQPEFQIDLQQAKVRLADGLASYASERASSLPTCSLAESRNLAAAGNVDVFSANCLPIGISPAQVASELRSEVINSDQFLDDTKIDSKDLKIDREGKALSFTELPELKKIQSGYQLSAWLVYLFAITSAVSFGGIVFLSSTKRRGLERAGAITFISGVAVGTIWFMIDRSASWLNDRSISLAVDSGVAQDVAANILKAISNDIGGLLLWYTAGYISVGVLGLLIAKFYRRAKTEKKSEPLDTKPIGDDSSNLSKKEPPKTES